MASSACISSQALSVSRSTHCPQQTHSHQPHFSLTSALVPCHLRGAAFASTFLPTASALQSSPNGRIRESRCPRVQRRFAIRAQSHGDEVSPNQPPTTTGTALLDRPVESVTTTSTGSDLQEKDKVGKAFNVGGKPPEKGGGIAGLVGSVSERAVSNLIGLLYKPVEETNPILEGNFAPVNEIGKRARVDVIEGAIPADFPAGAYVRVGPNPYFPQRTLKSPLGRTAHHWFEGDGMLHATSFEKNDSEEQAVFYKNKYLDTPGLRLEKERGRPLFLGTVDCDQGTLIANALLNQARFGAGNKNTANTSVVLHSGKVYAAWEGGSPTIFSLPDLETQGFPEWFEGWKRPVTAHPKVDPVTNEMMFFGFDVPKPHAVYGVLSPEGEIVHKVDLNFERATFMHDMAITEKYTLFLDLPLTLSTERLKEGKPLIDFETDSFARVGVIPRFGNQDSLKWFDVQAGFAFHVLNAFEDGDEVVLHGQRSRSVGLTPPRGMTPQDYFRRGIRPTPAESAEDPLLDGGLVNNLYEWRLDMQTGETNERMLSDWKVSGDFPRVNENHLGRRTKYGYVAVHDIEACIEAALPLYGGIGKFHIPANAKESELPVRMDLHTFGPGRFGGEPVFVPRPGGKDEDDGWLVTYVYDENTNESEMYIIDAKEVDKEAPTARIKIPQRIPYGFHGQWIPA
ncbi:hypothetical protein KFL_000820180 [Klebsormidium nitens]|uniref:Carotenoid oxygenase n=1 Tax=Klebsormidium nitens TaxID=105231 RepID=A0A1Y1HX13_KLENI|nr:hypothetical protein KFL_000820180 [Klebsormidium nitens]|eukprot:GAQ81511.1 hypothetical protein KFL_000820180 [Klebsormidium nitens]